MLDKMYEVKNDPAINKYIISIIGTEKHEDYVIVCTSEHAAKSLCAQILMKMVPSPSDSPMKYKLLGIHPNGHTNLYVLKPS
jgi:hypothetical protein